MKYMMVAQFMSSAAGSFGQRVVMKRFGRLTVCMVIFSASGMHAAYAEQSEKLILETGVSYFSGDYGTTEHTDIVYVPVTAKLQCKDWSVKLTIPYLEITGTGAVMSGVGQTVVPATTSRVRSGWGDVNAAATLNVYDGGQSGVAVSVTGKIKFATASESKGLSSGQNDYAAELTLFQRFDEFTPFGTIGYKQYGSPAAYTLNNVFYGSVGTSYKLNPGASLGAMLTAGQKVMDSRADRSEVLLFANYMVNRKIKVQGYVLKGLTSSVPDWGGGLLFDYMFDTTRPAQNAASSGYSGA